MATVNFQCGHCHNLMAVGEESLGQQVRCPHCQQVVLAPAPSPPPADLPAVAVPRPEEGDSIFTPPEASQDDLFGTPIPRVELPTEPVFPRLGLDEPTLPTDPAAPPPPAPAEPPTITYTPAEAAPAPSITEVVPPDGAAAPAGAEAPAPAPPEEGLPLPVMQKPRVARSNPWVIPLVIAPLVFYSLMATIYILDTQFLHFFTPPPPPHPLEILPDLEGDNKGAATRGGKHSSVPYVRPDPEQALDPSLRVRLGQTHAVGDLEVTPVKVEQRRHALLTGRAVEPFAEDVLSVTLRLRNRSADVTFKPMDRFFSAAWSNKSRREKPYTLLEMGDRKFYGGPLPWISLATARKTRDYIDYVDKQEVNTELKPGEQMTTFFCTNPEDHVVKALEGYQGRLLWRVQLRRGLVKWTTQNGVTREDPATTVVGIEFAAADVTKAAD
jgi:hypothetical protein